MKNRDKDTSIGSHLQYLSGKLFDAGVGIYLTGLMSKKPPDLKSTNLFGWPNSGHGAWLPWD